MSISKIKRFYLGPVIAGLVLFLVACSSPEPVTEAPASTSTAAPEALFTTTAQPDSAPTEPLVDPSPTPVVSTRTPDPSPTVSIAQPTPLPAPSATPGPSPTPLADSIFGIEIKPVAVKGGLALINETDTSWVRGISISWQDVEPVPGARNWYVLAGTETEMITAAENGLTPIILLQGAPVWARLDPDYACGPIHPDHLEFFAAFLSELVARYHQAPYRVKFWEIWNEPDVGIGLVRSASGFGCWGDAADRFYGGGRYAEMLKVVYPIVKSADPEAQILLGGLLLDCNPTNPPENPLGSGEYKDCSSSEFLRGVLENGGGDFFDGVSFHAYDYYYGEIGQYGNSNWHSIWNENGPVLVSKSRFLKALLSEYGVGDKLLLNTESGLLCGTTGKEAPCLTETFNNTKAYYLTQAYATALAEGLQANIWYSFRGWRASGFVRVNLEPLPVYDAYQFSASQLTGAMFIDELPIDPGVRVLAFEQAGKPLWILWSLDGNTHPILLPDRPAAIFDVFGTEQTLSRAVDATLSPLFIVWEPE